MKNQEVEEKLNNVENYLYEIDKLAGEIKEKYEFSAETGTIEKIKKLASEAKVEVAGAKAKNQ